MENLDLKDLNNGDASFQILVAFRDMLNLAIKKEIPPTYEKTLDFLSESFLTCMRGLSNSYPEKI
ncbi:MAG: hypothetical protein DI598_08275 [Pseudopedobacter saltans]|uniref:Uncharacterized protein n=1 Tax=Pseudopedobacter saltans TaxID=151895 RepID=A0A2W5F3C3_9SPHI|nr:MAG: hypothetical protein DI598_08275 [Pseudopedobacter saltans]